MKFNLKEDNYYDKLTEAEKKIWRLIYYIPNLISDRASALETLFCIIGTGLEWKDGEIIDTLDDNYLTAHKRRIKSFEKDFYEEVWKNTFGKPRFGKSLQKSQVEWMRAYSFYENCHAQYVWDNIEKLVTTSIPKKYFYPLGTYANLLEVPNDVKPDWLDLAIETCDLIMLCDPTFVTPDGGFRNKENIKIAEKTKAELEKLKYTKEH